MGEIITWNGRQREIVRVKSDNKDHNGYYTTFRDMMKPGEVEYLENEPVKDKPKEEITAEPAKPKRKSKKEV